MVKLREIAHHAKEYADMRIELAELKFSYKSSVVASTVITGTVLLLIFFIFMLVMTVFASLLIGKYLGEMYFGFLVMAIFYLIIGLILYAKRNDWIKKPFQNLLVKEIASEN